MRLNALRHSLLHARHRRRWRLLLIVLLGGAAWFAFKPALPAQELPHLDKLRHIGAFFTLSMVAMLGWTPHARLEHRVAAGLLAYGLFIEAVQTQLPSRSGSLADWAADAAGIAMGLLLARLLRDPR
jgi:VanZ family protein